jgi:hypothetical protein
MRPPIPWYLSPDEADALVDCTIVACDAATMRPEPPTIAPPESVRERIAGVSARLEELVTSPIFRSAPGAFLTPDMERFRLLWWLDELRAEEQSWREEAAP